MEHNEGSKNVAESNSGASINVRVPKRVLHFSDGTIEEFSEDETETTPQADNSVAAVDPKTLTWGPWMMHYVGSAGSSTLAVCDYLGESLASFLGITTPKYYFEIEEYKKREAKKRELEERAKGWSDNTANMELVTSGPTPV